MKQQALLKTVFCLAALVLMVQCTGARARANAAGPVGEVIRVEEKFAEAAFEATVKDAFISRMNEGSNDSGGRTTGAGFGSVQKDAEGYFGRKFIIDLGCRHPEPTLRAENTAVLPAPKRAAKGSPAEMLKADGLLTQPGRTVLHPALRLLHDGERPRTGESAQAAILQQETYWRFNVAGSVMASSGDSGVVYGYC